MFVNRDFNGATRSTQVSTGAPDIGAVEFTPTVNPAPMTILGTIGGGNTQRMVSYGDTVATLLWGFSGTLPTGITATYHTGAKVVDPTNNGNNPNAEVMDVFWRIAPNGGSLYSYDLTLTYDPNMLGTVPFMSDIKLAHKTSASAGSWSHYGSTMTAVDTVNNRFTVTGISASLGDFTGTTDIAPLPVTLSRFEAMRSGEDALLAWNTVSEINSKVFVVERAEDATRFVRIGEVAAAGNSSKALAYQFDDKNAAQIFNGKHVYYRLKMIDRDGSFEYSNTISINNNDEEVTLADVKVFPNPFNNDLYIDYKAASNETVELRDMSGRVIFTQTLNSADMVHQLNIPSSLDKGIYILTFSSNSAKSVKVVRN